MRTASASRVQFARCCGEPKSRAAPRVETGESVRKVSASAFSAKRPSRRLRNTPRLISNRISRATLSGSAPMRPASSSLVSGPAASASAIPSCADAEMACDRKAPKMMSMTAIGGEPGAGIAAPHDDGLVRRREPPGRAAVSGSMTVT